MKGWVRWAEAIGVVVVLVEAASVTVAVMVVCLGEEALEAAVMVVGVTAVAATAVV